MLLHGAVHKSIHAKKQSIQNQLEQIANGQTKSHQSLCGK